MSNKDASNFMFLALQASSSVRHVRRLVAESVSFTFFWRPSHLLSLIRLRRRTMLETTAWYDENLKDCASQTTEGPWWNHWCRCFLFCEGMKNDGSGVLNRKQISQLKISSKSFWNGEVKCSWLPWTVVQLLERKDRMLTTYSAFSAVVSTKRSRSWLLAQKRRLVDVQLTASELSCFTTNIFHCYHPRQLEYCGAAEGGCAWQYACEKLLWLYRLCPKSLVGFHTTLCDVAHIQEVNHWWPFPLLKWPSMLST